MELRALSIFMKVADRRSFVRAAVELGMSQSGVSNAVARLERELGIRLLARTTRSVRLTEDGAAFAQRCRQILSDLKDAEAILSKTGLAPVGRLRVDLPVAFGRIKIVPLLGEFHALYPQVDLAITFRDRYVDLVDEGVDVAVRFGALTDSSLIAKPLTRTQFRVVGASSYFKKHARPKSLQSLVVHNCMGLALRDASSVRDWRFKQGKSEVKIAPKGNMVFSDGSALCEAVLAGYGLAQIHDYYVDGAIAAGDLEPVLDKFRPDPDRISIVYPAARHLSPRIRVFIDFLVLRVAGMATTAHS